MRVTGPCWGPGRGIRPEAPASPRPAAPLSPSPLPGLFLFQTAGRLQQDDPRMREMKLQDLKSKSPTELLAFAEEHSVENASTMRKQEQMFAILKQLAAKEIAIMGEGAREALSD